MLKAHRKLAAAAALLVLGLSVYAAQVVRPYRNGSVWSVAFIRVKPGMDEEYMKYISRNWKAEHEALKKENIILSYKVMTTEAHSPTDWNMLLMTEYKDLATMEANAPKEDELAQKIFGDDQQQMQGYKEREEIREVMGTRLARELVLEPRQ
jgi:hypothetical protein